MYSKWEATQRRMDAWQPGQKSPGAVRVCVCVCMRAHIHVRVPVCLLLHIYSKLAFLPASAFSLPRQHVCVCVRVRARVYMRVCVHCMFALKKNICISVCVCVL